MKGGRCVDTSMAVATPNAGQKCLWPRVKLPNGEGCGCAPGYGEKGGQCVKGAPPAGIVAAATSEAGQPIKLKTSIRDLVLLQNCLKEAGYLEGEVGKKVKKAGWTAFWYFKRDHKVGRTPNGMYNIKAQEKLLALCPKLVAATAAGTPPRADAGETEQAISPRPDQPKLARPVSYARPETGCLPGDLYNLIQRTYGKRKTLKRCTETCVPIPKELTKQEISDYEKMRGIRWCKSCIELVSHLPLDDILRIERGAKVQICTRPPTQLPSWSHPTRREREAYTKVRELFRPHARKSDHAGDIAVVIGNGSYTGELPAHQTAPNDADAIYSLLTEHLGFKQANIIHLRDARLRDLRELFGRGEKYDGKLKRLLAQRPEARVIIYYAGHASTNAGQSDSYLLPVDAVARREEQTGFAMSQLYASLQQLNARSVTLLLETSFGRDVSDFVFPPNLPETGVKAFPARQISGLTVLTAADRDQKALDDPHYAIGLFTRYLIEGLAGAADIAPIGNDDGKIDAVELYAYTAHMVDLTARKSYGLLQKPGLNQRKNLVLSSLRQLIR